MGHSLGDSLIVAALAALAFGYLYLKYRQKMGRLEAVHKERLAAMDKGVPLPEFPLDPPAAPSPPDPDVPVVIGIVLTAFGVGAMIALACVLPAEQRQNAVVPLPVVFMGLGLALYYYYVAPRREKP